MESINWGNILTELIVTVSAALILGIFGYFKRKSLSAFIKKTKFRLQPRKFQIVFAIEFEEGLNTGIYYEQIKKNLSKQIDNCDLSNKIKLLDISDIYLFKTKADAEKFRKSHDLDLIIWGDFSKDKLKIDNESVNKIDLNFTFRIPQNLNQLRLLIAKDLQSKFAQKSYWKIYKNNSLKDIEIISNNIFDISTYILALSLKVFGKLNDSTTLFENLHTTLIKRNDTLSSQIIPHLVNCYDILSIEYGSYAKNYKKGIMYCDKILNLQPKHFSAICNKAIYQYRSGHKDEAFQNIRRLKELYPNNDITIIDVAFFRILEKDYPRALGGYKKLHKKFRKVSFNTPEVIEFLEEQYLQLNDPAILFASGFLNGFYGDLLSGKDDLNKFLSEANPIDHELLIREAKRLLSIDFK